MTLSSLGTRSRPFLLVSTSGASSISLFLLSSLPLARLELSLSLSPFFIFFQLVVLRQNVLLFLIGLLFPGVVLVPRLMQLRGDALLPDN